MYFSNGSRVLLLLVATSLLVPGVASGLGIYQELPRRVNLNELYAEVLVQVQDPDWDYEGVCDAALIWASDAGATIRVLDQQEASCHEYNRGNHEDFRFAFNVTNEDAEYGRDYQFIVQVEMQGEYDTYVKTSEYSVKVNPRLNAAFSVSKEGRAVQVDASKSFTLGNENLNFVWNWGDGSALDNTTSPVTEHLYPADGAYIVTLTTQDAFGQSTSTSQTVFIQSSEGHDTAAAEGSGERVQQVPNPPFGLFALAVVASAAIRRWA